jgi:tetratricopeptide (TPR) repeat protein
MMQMRNPMLTRLRWIVALLALGTGLTLGPPQAQAQSETELQALRQLDFSKAEIAKGSFERALSSASAAFRLDPTLYDALAYKALAYEGLGELRLAEGLLTTYMDIRGSMDPLTEAEAALLRVSAKLGGGAATEGADEVTTDGTPGEQTTEDPSAVDDSVTASGTTEEGDDDEEGPWEAQEEESESGESAPPAPKNHRDLLAELLPSDTALAGLHLLHQRGIIESRMQSGGGLMAAGLGLSALGGVMMLVSSVEYARVAEAEGSTDQAAAAYAGAMGMLGAGGAMAAVGVPIFVKARVDLSKLDGFARSLAARPVPRLELMAQGVALRF